MLNKGNTFAAARIKWRELDRFTIGGWKNFNIEKLCIFIYPLVSTVYKYWNIVNGNNKISVIGTRLKFI